jgi:GT2 family glycosyltransferase
MSRVTAVVVTYNRRELLNSCLHSLIAQSFSLDRIVVVDNASTDGSEEVVGSFEGVELVRLEENLGSAGGFAAGVEAALAEECDWIWLMDDDAEPAPDALERLLASSGADDPTVAALCPAVVLPDGAIDVKHRGTWRKRPRPLPASEYVAGTVSPIDFFTWVGPLIRAEAARAAGPPMAELFIWADDYEYSFRVRRHGDLRLVPASRVVHHDARGSHHTRRSRLVNRLTGWDYEPAPYAAFWRNLCGIRNYVWLKKRHEGESALGAAGTTAQFMLKALLYDDRPLSRLRWLARFARDGRRGHFVRFGPEEWARLNRPS